MDGIWSLGCLKKHFDLLVQMALSKVAPLAFMVVKNETKKKSFSQQTCQMFIDGIGFECIFVMLYDI